MTNETRSTLDMLFDTAQKVGARAFTEMTSTEQRRQVLAAAVRGVQEGRRLIDENSAKLVQVLGLATQDDVQRLSQRLGRVRKRLRRLVDES